MVYLHFCNFACMVYYTGGNDCMEYKQQKIIRSITENITNGKYSYRLPAASQLAEEFNVNIKTVYKAVHKLCNEGILNASPKTGITVSSSQLDMCNIVEIFYEGYCTLQSHPFWSVIYKGINEVMKQNDFKIVLRELASDPDSGILQMPDIQNISPVGRIVLGVSEKRFFRKLKLDKIPFIVAGDSILDIKVPQVSFDFSKGICDAVNFLHQQGCRKIAFIGEIQTFSDSGVLKKFHAYCNAVREYHTPDSELIVNARPLAQNGAIALKYMLDSGTIPDSIIGAYDAQLPAIYDVLKAHDLNIPVIGCDGINIPGLPDIRPMVAVPLEQCGRLASIHLINSINSHHKVKSAKLAATFKYLSVTKNQ